MNNVFVDVLTSGQDFKFNFIEKIELKLFGFVLREDKIIKSDSLSTFFVVFDLEKLDQSSKSFKKMCSLLKRKKKEKNINIIFSRNISLNTKLKSFFVNNMKSVCIDFNYIEVENKLKDLDMQYISRYILEKKIDKNKFKILITIDNIKDFDLEKIKEYISTYKFVDILKTKNVSKFDYNKLSKIVENLNNEYGTSIEIIQKRNIQCYDFYMLYSPNIKEYFKSHYILNRRAYILDITDIDDDVFSKEYRSYQKNKPYLDTLFNRLNINLERFVKSELGLLYIKY